MESFENDIIAMITPVKPAEVNKLTYFRDLTGYEQPLKRIPEDYSDAAFTYPTRHEPRCAICCSSYRSLAEMVYLRTDKTVLKVMKFFEEYFAAKLTWPCVSIHMTKHCSFGQIDVNGLSQLIQVQDSQLMWAGREDTLAITVLMDQIDRVQGLEISNRPSLVLDKARTLRDLAIKLAELSRTRDERAIKTINPFEVLTELFNEVQDKRSKDLIRRKVMQLRSQLNAVTKT